MTKKVLVPIADGSEEMEAVILIDVLRRAELNVTVASVSGSKIITASRGVRIESDVLISECITQIFDAIAIPGGMPGAENIGNSPIFLEILKHHINGNCLIAAICAAPAVVFCRNKLFEQAPLTSHPAFQHEISEKYRRSDRVVISDNVISSQGPGTAFEFALAIVAKLQGNEKKDGVSAPLILNN